MPSPFFLPDMSAAAIMGGNTTQQTGKLSQPIQQTSTKSTTNSEGEYKGYQQPQSSRESYFNTNQQYNQSTSQPMTGYPPAYVNMQPQQPSAYPRNQQPFQTN